MKKPRPTASVFVYLGPYFNIAWQAMIKTYNIEQYHNKNWPCVLNWLRTPFDPIKKWIHFNYYQFIRYDYYVTINQLSGFISFVTFSPWTTFHSLNMLSKQIPTLNKTLMLNQYLIPFLCFPISNCFNHIDQPILMVDGMWPLLAGHKNTDIFIRLSFVCPGLIMPFKWKSVSLCIFLLVSVILFYPEEQVFFHICSKYAKEREEYIFHAMNMKLPVIVIMIMPHTKNIGPFTNTQKNRQT